MKIKAHYQGNDLGATYTCGQTRFRVWAPAAGKVGVRLYKKGLDSPAVKTVAMKRGAGGTWTASIRGDLEGLYYMFQVHLDGEVTDAVDPYSRAVGANGLRGQIVDLNRTNPRGWERDRAPEFLHPTDAVIYELHVRDASIHTRIDARGRGKFLGVASDPVMSHLRQLGVTHLHLLPVFDFESIDETKPSVPQFNWGYDPQNYNTPEGSYSTNPRDGHVRIREFKQMVMALHRAGIRVVMDVVYNHTYRAQDSCFNKLAPGYYYRQGKDGKLSNGSGCGNETASDRPMFGKFMVDSLVYWAKEYHVDGFRFDLMGLHDLATMRKIRSALDRVDPSIILYGEGWTGGDSPLPEKARATKTNVARLRGVAAFSDTIRDALKGPVWDKSAAGFAAGMKGHDEAVKAGIVASTAHPQVAYPAGNAWQGPWAVEPWRCITYDSCHDNHTLWDKLSVSCAKISESERIKMNKLCAAVVLTSQGIPFLHAGEEFLRTKKGEENSYNKPDSVNALDWRRRARFGKVVDYYRGLIELRKAQPSLRLKSAREIRKRLRFLKMPGTNLVGYAVDSLVVIFNGRPTAAQVKLPGKNWEILVDAQRAGNTSRGTLRRARVVVPGRSALVLRKADGA